MRARGYEPGHDVNFQADLALGEEAEKYHEYMLSLQGHHEIKRDLRTWETNNFYVEFEQSNDGYNYYPSGISVTTSLFWFWASPNLGGHIMIETGRLKELIALNNFKEAVQPVYSSDTNSSRGYLIPRDVIMKELGFLKMDTDEKYNYTSRGGPFYRPDVSWS